MRSWRNWQTHQLEGLAVAIPWWFESTRPHQNPGFPDYFSRKCKGRTHRARFLLRTVFTTRTIQRWVGIRVRYASRAQLLWFRNVLGNIQLLDSLPGANNLGRRARPD
jgi:hypothetical protein